MRRREFIGAVIAGAVPLFVPVPKWIGEHAGGFYAPVPDDLSEYVSWGKPVYPNESVWPIHHGLLMVLWAPLGSSTATYQYAATSVMEPLDRRHPRMLERKKQNAVNSLREYLVQRHDPGWLKVHETYKTIEPQGYNEDGEPYYYASRSVWRRCGYVRWMKPAEVTAAVVHLT